jgi:hypothetical protein
VFGTAYANEAKAKVNTTLITNVRIFDGKSDKLSKPMSVLVKNSEIMWIRSVIFARSGQASSWRINND